MVAIEVVVARLVSVWHYKMERIVVNIDTAFTGIGGIEVTLTLNQGAGQPSVDRPIGHPGHGYSMRGGRRRSICQSDIRVPCGNRSIECDKDKNSGSARQHKVGCASIGDDARWRTVWRTLIIWIRGWNCDGQGLFRTWAVVQSSDSCHVVCNPPDAAGSACQAPGINQLRIRSLSNSRRVGLKIGLGIV